MFGEGMSCIEETRVKALGARLWPCEAEQEGRGGGEWEGVEE